MGVELSQVTEGQRHRPSIRVLAMDPSQISIHDPFGILKMMLAYQPIGESICDEPSTHTMAMEPSRLFIHDTLGVLELMWNTDRSICVSVSGDQAMLSASRKLRKQLLLGESECLSNLSVYQYFDDERLNDGTGEYDTFVLFPLYTKEDGLTPFGGFRLEPDNTLKHFYLKEPQSGPSRSGITLPKPRGVQISMELYRAGIKQSCEAVSRMFEDYYSCYFTDRWRNVHRLPTPQDRDFLVIHSVPNFDLGMSHESLETFRPFNNIQIKALQRARFDPNSQDVSRSVKLLLPHLPWNIVEEISDQFYHVRQVHEKALKKSQGRVALGPTPHRGYKFRACRRFYVHFNRREVDLICMDTASDFQDGEVETRFSLRHAKFSILDDTETVPLIGPLPAPLGIADSPTGPTYKIAVYEGLDNLDKDKADGILGVTNSVRREPLTQTSPTPQSL
ncbi:hypothetical protein BGX33_001853, partial [Mortierella sp. NVP41]